MAADSDDERHGLLRIDSKRHAELEPLSFDLDFLEDFRSLRKVLHFASKSAEGGPRDWYQGWLHTPALNNLAKTKWRHLWGHLYTNETGALLFSFGKTEGQQMHTKTVQFISVRRLHDDDKEDALYIQQTKSLHATASSSVDRIDRVVCRYRFVFWTKHSTFEVAPASTEATQEWVGAFQAALEHRFSREDIEAKCEAAARLWPLLRRQREVQVAEYYNLVKLSRTAGLGHIDPAIKFQGRARLWDSTEKAWFEVRLVLYHRFLEVFSAVKEAERIPVAVISLRFVVSVSKPACLRNNRFRLMTPLQVYSFMAKHDSSADNWIFEIGRQKFGKSFESRRLEASDDGQALQVSYGKKKLSWQATNSVRKGSYKLKKGETIIGRSSSARLCLSDAHISRHHAKIINNPGHPLMIEDLGAAHRTTVNGQKIQRAALKNGDQIGLGGVVMTLIIADDARDHQQASENLTEQHPDFFPISGDHHGSETQRLLHDSDYESDD